MKNLIDTREIAIVVVASNHNPTILNPDFLKYNSIVQADWDLSRSPICIEPMAEVAFNSGVKITAQIDKVIFHENVKDGNITNLNIPDIAVKYTTTLPHVEYKAIGINFRGHIILGENLSPQEYMINSLIVKGPWSDYGISPVQSKITFSFSLEDSMSNLTMEQKSIKIANDVQIPVLFFGSNFHHELEGQNREERLGSLIKIINNWEIDCDKFHELVNSVFFNERVRNEYKLD